MSRRSFRTKPDSFERTCFTRRNRTTITLHDYATRWLAANSCPVIVARNRAPFFHDPEKPDFASKSEAILVSENPAKRAFVVSFVANFVDPDSDEVRDKVRDKVLRCRENLRLY